MCLPGDKYKEIRRGLSYNHFHTCTAFLMFSRLVSIVYKSSKLFSKQQVPMLMMLLCTLHSLLGFLLSSLCHGCIKMHIVLISMEEKLLGGMLSILVVQKARQCSFQGICFASCPTCVHCSQEPQIKHCCR